MRIGSPDGQAWHEAGHGVIATLLGGTVQRLTLEDDDDAFDGRATIAWPAGGAIERAKTSAMTALAGPVSELVFEGELDPDDEQIRQAWRGDWEEVERCATIVEDDPEKRTDVIKRWLRDVEAMVVEPRTHEVIARVADALDAHGTLDEDLLLECF